MKDKKYPVHEAFYTFQGEGVHMGKAAYFVRLFGCDQRCHFCDSAGTWHKDWMPSKVSKLSAADIVARALDVASKQSIIILTGGEPALHNLKPLIATFHAVGFASVHIETAGHKPLPDSLDWITLSPKTFSIPPLNENLAKADELKLIVETPEGLQRDINCINQVENTKAVIWLHPEWGKRKNPEVMNLITETVKSNPRYRAGYQIHKMYQADTLDPNAAKIAAPLGGDVKNGSSI